MLKFFDWAYKTGGKQANELDYATLPKEVVEQVRAARKTNVKTVQVKRCTNNAGARVRRAHTVLQAPISVGAAGFKQRVIYG